MSHLLQSDNTEVLSLPVEPPPAELKFSSLVIVAVDAVKVTGAQRVFLLVLGAMVFYGDHSEVLLGPLEPPPAEGSLAKALSVPIGSLQVKRPVFGTVVAELAILLLLNCEDTKLLSMLSNQRQQK